MIFVQNVPKWTFVQLYSSWQIVQCRNAVETYRYSTGETSKIDRGLFLAKYEELTHCSLPEHQEEGTDALEWGGNGVIVELWLLTDGGALLLHQSYFTTKEAS